MNGKEKINVLILAGGMGSRFKEVSEKIPKVFYPFVDEIPFVYYVMQDIESELKNIRFYFLMHEHYELGEEQLRNFYDFEVVLEKKRLGTGGAIAQAFQTLEIKDAIILNGDSYTKVDWYSFLDFCKNRKMAIVAGKSSGTSNYNIQKLTDDRGIFEGDGSIFINQGVYYLTREMILNLSQNQEIFSLEHSLKKKEIDIFFNMDSLLFDIGTQQGALRFQDFLRR